MIHKLDQSVRVFLATEAVGRMILMNPKVKNLKHELLQLVRRKRNEATNKA